MCFIKKQAMSLATGIKIFFRKQKVVWFKGWNLQKKMVLEKENSKFEKNIAIKKSFKKIKTELFAYNTWTEQFFKAD